MAFLYKAYQFSTKTHLWDLFNDRTGTLKLQFEDWSEYIGSTIGGNVIGWEWLIWLIWWNVIGWSQRCWMIIKSYPEAHPKSSTYVYAISKFYLEGFPFIPCQQEGNASAAWQIGSEPPPDSSDSTIPKLTQKLLKLQAVPLSTKTPTFFFHAVFLHQRKQKHAFCVCVCVCRFFFQNMFFGCEQLKSTWLRAWPKNKPNGKRVVFFWFGRCFGCRTGKNHGTEGSEKTLFWWDLVTRRNF